MSTEGITFVILIIRIFFSVNNVMKCQLFVYILLTLLQYICAKSKEIPINIHVSIDIITNDNLSQMITLCVKKNV